MVNFLKKNYLYVIIVAVTLIGLLIVYIPRENTSVNQNDFNPIGQTSDSNEIEYIYVDIKGAIFNPGVYKLEKYTRLYQAVAKAGGLLSTADYNAVNLSVLLNDQQAIYIPYEGEDFPNIANNDSQSGNQMININNASSELLQTLPGVGPSTAQSIIDYRDANGYFSTIEEIMEVTGIGETTYDKLKDYITT